MAAWNPKADEILVKALKTQSLLELRDYLEQACAGNTALRKEVNALIRANLGAGSFLEKPALAADATRDPAPQAPPEPGPGNAAGPNGAPHPLREIPGARIGPFKLLQEIGEGGMGTVFMAQQLEPVRRKVALKVIKPGMDSKEVLARFEAERQAIALMDHPHIAKVFDAGTTDSGRPFFVMELVKGPPLTKHCDEQQLSTRERLELFIPVCQAIQHAHQKGVIHRDIKPSNILVASYDGKPVPKVIDFGVAKATGHNLTERTLFTAFGNIVGTLEYMSPEQAELSAVDIDTRSDVYSLGVLLYELLTGTTPLSRKRLKQEAMHEALRLIREEEPPKPSTRLSSSQALPALSAQRNTQPAKLAKMMRGELDWMVMKALEKDRTRRYETANALVRDIERYLHDEPVEAGPPSTAYRLRKLAHRHRTATRVAAAFVMLLVVGVIASTWQMVRAIQAEAATGKERDRTVKAKAATDRALKQSELAKEQAQAVSTYLVEAFRSPDPTRDGREVKVAEVLDRAAATLDDHFAGSDTIKGDLLCALGQTYQGLGLQAKAVELHEKALALRRATLGPDHVDTLRSMGDLAWAYHIDGRWKESVTLSEQRRKLTKDKLGPDHYEMLRSMGNLADVYREAGRFAESITLNEDTVKLYTAMFGPDDMKTLVVMNNLATAYRFAGRLADAIKLLDKTLKTQKVKVGPDHRTTLNSIMNLAAFYLDAGRLAEAIALFEDTIKLHTAKLGENHYDTLQAMTNLARGYQESGRLAEAIALQEKTLKLCTAHVGPDDPQTREGVQILASFYVDAGRLAEAIPLAENAAKFFDAKFGHDHPRTLLSVANLAEVYQAAGRLPQAIQLFEATRKLETAKLGPDHFWTLYCGNCLAAAYVEAGRLADGIPIHQETLKLQKAKLGFDHPQTLTTMNDLAVAYRVEGRLPEAIPLFDDTLKFRQSKLGNEHPETLKTMNNLAVAYVADGRLAEAIALHEQTLKLQKFKRGPDHPDTLSTMNNLALAYQADGRLPEAIPLFEEALKFRKVKLGPDHPDTLRSINNLATALKLKEKDPKK